VPDAHIAFGMGLRNWQGLRLLHAQFLTQAERATETHFLCKVFYQIWQI
jgi:hypothetical protein